MNKRARVAQIRRTILGRAIEMFVSSDNDKLTFAEAQRLAAKRAAQSAPSTSGEGNARETLFSRVMSIRERMFPDANPDDDMTAALSRSGSKPGGMIRQVLKRIKLAEDEPVAPIASKPVEAKPGPSSTYTEVWIGRSSHVDLNQEFDGRPFRDNETTSNWRKAIEAASKPRVVNTQDEVDPTNPAAVEAALQRQVSFLRVVK
jgi:hypothetical protein